jgi:hypothetical protein
VSFDILMKLQSASQFRMIMKWVGLRRTAHVLWASSAIFFAETRRNALKYLTRNETSGVRCCYLRVSLIHLTLNKPFIKWYGIGRKYNILSLFIENTMAPLKLRIILSNVITVLTCQSYSVEAASAIFMVSLLMYYITWRHIAFVHRLMLKT